MDAAVLLLFKQLIRFFQAVPFEKNQRGSFLLLQYSLSFALQWFDNTHRLLLLNGSLNDGVCVNRF